MKLTKSNKEFIDSLSYICLLERWRFAPVGDVWFEGETGDYWKNRMKELRDKPDGQKEHVNASKIIGWEISK